MKPLWIASVELMFNKQLMQYQIFIKNPPTKCALQKTFLPFKIKNENSYWNFPIITKIE